MGHRGFFAASTLISKRQVDGKRAPLCGKCGLYKHCLSPKMKVQGEGGKGILLVTGMPSKREDKKGLWHEDEAGDYLEERLANCGIDVKEDCWTTGALICNSKKKMLPVQVEYCRANLINTIEELKPSKIILLGAAATVSCIGWLWKEKIGAFTRWTGWNIPSQSLNAWVCPTFHPSLVMNEEKRPVMPKVFQQDLERACALEGRPWDDIPDYGSQIETIHDPDEAAEVIRYFTKKGGLTAFDYECDRKKPEPRGASIVCASICWRGKRTISYPWMGDAITATEEYLRSDVPKIASNMKFEQRWTKRILGFRIRNWVWDTMLGAHVLDNRQGITGLKFQTFVHLGITSYNEHIERFLRSKSSNLPNNIKEIDLEQLLKYNGLDSLLEYIVGVRQMKQLYGENWKQWAQ